MNRLVATASLLDAIIGDPAYLPHPVRYIGKLITQSERLARSLCKATPKEEFVAGALLTISTVTISVMTARAIQHIVARSIPPCASIVEAVIGASTLATRDMLEHVARVEQSLEQADIDAARMYLGHIVGRDTQELDASAIAGAAIETLAESFCDGIVAPLFYLTFGGISGAVAFKAISTLDSMIGHREAPYTHFGTFAARCDDILNFLPARIAACTLTVFAPLINGLQTHAFHCILHDAQRHLSVNAGYPEAAMAGALHVRLGGSVIYDGIPTERPIVNKSGHKPTLEDLRDAMRLVAVASAALAFVSSLATRSRSLLHERRADGKHI